MSASSIARAAADQQLKDRVNATVHKEAQANATFKDTDYGRQLQQGMTDGSPLMWPVAVATEAAYEAALVSGRGAPGHDTDIITDAAITSAVQANWPMEDSTPNP